MSTELTQTGLRNRRHDGYDKVVTVEDDDKDEDEDEDKDKEMLDREHTTCLTTVESIHTTAERESEPSLRVPLASLWLQPLPSEAKYRETGCGAFIDSHDVFLNNIQQGVFAVLAFDAELRSSPHAEHRRRALRRLREIGVTGMMHGIIFHAKDMVHVAPNMWLATTKLPDHTPDKYEAFDVCVEPLTVSASNTVPRFQRLFIEFLTGSPVQNRADNLLRMFTDTIADNGRRLMRSLNFIDVEHGAIEWLKHQYPCLEALQLCDKVQLAGGSVCRAVNQAQGIITVDYVKCLDLDIFFGGMTPEEAREQLRLRLESLYAWCQTNDHCMTVVVDKHVTQVTLTNNKYSLDHSINGYFYTQTFGTRHPIMTADRGNQTVIQFIHRIFASPADILYGFDCGPSELAFNGVDILCTPLAAFSLRTRYMIVDTTHSSATYSARLAKYLNRGFGILFPYAKCEPTGVWCTGHKTTKHICQQCATHVRTAWTTMPLPFERACKVAKRETVPSSPPPSRWTFESFTLDDGIVYVEHNATYGSDYLPDGHEDDPFGAAEGDLYYMATTMRRSYSIALNNRRHFRMLRAADTGTTFTTDRKLLRDIVFHVYGTYCIEHPEEESVFYHPFRNKCFKQYFTIPRLVRMPLEARRAFSKVLTDSYDDSNTEEAYNVEDKLKAVMKEAARIELSELTRKHLDRSPDFGHMVTLIEWNTRNPGTQITAAFNPDSVSAAEWYGPEAFDAALWNLVNTK